MRKSSVKVYRIMALLVAVVLLVSGFAKAADAAYFSNLIWNAFHSNWMAYAAVGVIIVEVLLGVLLLVQWKTRIVAILTAVLLVGVTGVYAYGVAKYGMVSCGCFGHLQWLNMGVAGTLIRNFLLLVVVIYLAWNKVPSWRGAWQVVLCVVVMILAAFMTGYTMRGSMVLFARSQGWQGKTIVESPMKGLCLSADSTYLVFAFSFNCPFCQMAVGNVSLYEQTGIVDRVVGLAVEDSLAEQYFLDVYNKVPFAYQKISLDSMNRLVPDLPTTYLVQRDTIRYVWTGEVPPPLFVK